MKKFLYWLIRSVINLLADVEIKGYENLPAKGGFVIATNHLGFLDVPLALYSLNDYDLFVLIGEKWKKNPIWRWLGKYFNFVFVDRFNADLKALREVIRRMENGQTLVIAPEGTRARDEKMAEGKPGVTYMAVKSGFPIVPVAIIGTEDRLLISNLKKFRKTKIHLIGGKPFTLPPIPRDKRDETLKQYTDEIMCRIAIMLPEHNRGYYVNHPRLKELLNEI